MKKSKTSDAPATGRANARADRVWQRLLEAYGSRFADQYGPDVNESWLESISLLSDEQIAFGLRAIKLQSPDHPPTLPRFTRACSDMPIAQQDHSATLQEQLCEYVMVKLYHGEAIVGGEGFPKKARDEISGRWTYVYRQWIDEAKKSGTNKEGKCAECTGVVIEKADGTRIGFSVAQMQSDTAWHQYVLAKFQRGKYSNGELLQRPSAAAQLSFEA